MFAFKNFNPIEFEELNFPRTRGGMRRDFPHHPVYARAGGNIVDNARKALEKRLKRSIVSGHNYLKERELQKRIK